MDKNKQAMVQMKIQRTMQALAKNRIPAFYAPTKEDAVKLVESMMEPGNVISCGGTVTLRETGIRDLMLRGKYTFLDREAMNPEEVYQKTFSADVFLTSANAITEEGQLYNVDGRGNRVAAMIYGPKKVIVVAGVNKIVRNVDEAIMRVKTTAAPPNALRQNMGTPCQQLGTCVGCKGEMAEGCAAETRMCCHYVVTGWQKTERIHVVLVGEDLGY
ncbi:MAG: lactate utilization protein [Acutalibacter sp.]|nr:lactate utilization protein [Acutalibacter sp.]